MNITEFLQSSNVMAFLVFILSSLVSYLTIPRVISVVKAKGLMDDPNERSSHTQKTPTMGGVAFYVSLMISLFFIRKFDVNGTSINIVAGLTMLFFVGLKDDLVGVRPMTKIWGQIIATLILFFSIGIEIHSFDNFLWINEIPLWVSIPFGCFLVLSIVNAYNLIDGINGSASMVGIVIFACFGFIFYNADKPYYFLMSVLCIGFLTSFLRYNLSSKKKIFMGDTGSMIVGFMISVLGLRFLSLSPAELESAWIHPSNKILILIAIIFVPFIDTTRVFLSRILRHGKPFKADRSHVHHVMIDYINLSHGWASVILALVNIIIFSLMMYVNTMFTSGYVLVFLILFSIATAVILFYFNKSYTVRKDKQKIRKVLNEFTSQQDENKSKKKKKRKQASGVIYRKV